MDGIGFTEFHKLISDIDESGCKAILDMLFIQKGNKNKEQEEMVLLTLFSEKEIKIYKTLKEG